MDLRKIVVTILIGFAGILIQGTLLRTLFPVGYVPNFLIAVLVFLALVEINVSGVLLAAFLGLLLDLSSSQFIGPWIGSFIVVFAVFSLFSTKLYVGSVFIFSCAVALASCLASLVYVFMILPYIEIHQSAFWIALNESLLSGLVAPLMYYVLVRMYPGCLHNNSLLRHAL